jgi:hypothetical protein
MEYTLFKNTFNEIIFDKSKKDLIEKIADNPSRYIGLFRPTKPKAKILQNLLQSHEIRFGDAFELVIEKYFEQKNYELLPKRYKNREGKDLNVDQCFRKNKKTYFIEQKVRDDHDSSKKTGQIDNFEKKIEILIDTYGDKNLEGYFYFIDPDLVKNRNYYQNALIKLSKDYGIKLYLCYGKELFDTILEPQIWTDIIKNLTLWKSELPDLPEINFDKDSKHSFEEIKDISPSIFRKLFDNETIYNEILMTIFPEKKTLKLLLQYFKEKSNEKKIYETLYEMLDNKIYKNR